MVHGPDHQAPDARSGRILWICGDSGGISALCSLSSVVAVSALQRLVPQVSTNDDVEHIGFGAFWSKLKEMEGPIVTVIKDIDSDPGRGASTGDGMARNQHFYGVVGQIYDGTVRDIPGPLQRVWLGSSST